VNHMRTPTLRARRFVAALLIPLLAACQSWRPTAAAPQTAIANEQPSSVRVTLMNGDVFTLRNPTITSDSIVGTTDAGVTAVASRDIRLFQLRRLHLPRTVVLGAGVALLASLAAFAAACVGDDGGGFSIC
jgi:hypothetical protein